MVLSCNNSHVWLLLLPCTYDIQPLFTIHSFTTSSHSHLLYPTGKLFFLSCDDPSRMQSAHHGKYVFINTDDSLVYTAFFADFGPLDLGLTYSFCQQLQEAMRSASSSKKSVIQICSNHPHRRANAVIHRNLTFTKHSHPFIHPPIHPLNPLFLFCLLDLHCLRPCYWWPIWYLSWNTL